MGIFWKFLKGRLDQGEAVSKSPHTPLLES
jgi:hypothetical protein